MSFLSDKVKERDAFILKNAHPEERNELLEELMSTVAVMSDSGVSSEDDYKDFFFISSHAKSIADDILGYDANDEELAKISHNVFINRQEYPINTLINFYKAVKNAINKSEITIKKKAYPQGHGNVYIKNPYNISKWIDSMRQIYAHNTRGYSFNKSFDIVTDKWDKMEKKEFSHWLKFYQSNSHNDYKIAQQRYYVSDTDDNEIPFSVLQNINALKANLRKKQDDLNAEDAKVHNIENKKKEESDEIADKMNKLIGRLNSAEKIFTSVDFKKVLGNDYDEWLECLHKLKRIIYSKQPKTASTVRDLIICQANVLRLSGNHIAGKLMDILASYQYSIMNDFDLAIGLPISKYAQAEPPSVNEEEPSAGELSGSSDLMGGDMGDMGDMGNMGDMGDKNRDLSSPEGAMIEFVKSLSGKDISSKKAFYFDDDEAMIVVAEDGFYKFAQNFPKPDQNILTEPAPGPIPEPNPESKLTPEDAKESGDIEVADDAIDKALRNVKLTDVIAKLEGLVQFYRNRQFSRELLIIDLMLEALNISAFFPSMAEAAKSSLDSNQYVLTRLEDMLAKLRGAAAADSGELASVKQKLQQESDNKDKRREERAKENMTIKPEVAEAPTPEVEFAQPTEIQESPQPAQVR